MNNDEKKEMFYEEMNEYDPPVYHVMEDIENITDPTLLEIDKFYGYADALSMENQKMYKNVILALSIAGAVITLSFLLYDEAEQFWLILPCTVYLVFLGIIKVLADKMDCHRKYLEYRVLAETMRVQFFLRFAGIKESVSEMMPWFIKIDIPWIEDVIAEKISLNQDCEKKPILNYWITDQRDYHQRAFDRDTPKHKREQRNQKIALYATIIIYFFTLFIEILIYLRFLGNLDINKVRALLKIAIGTAAVLALFSSSYYGKMSLSDTLDDHYRMIRLYNKVHDDIKRNNDVESEEIIKYLAKEFLTENSTWYSYQSQNKPDWVM